MGFNLPPITVNPHLHQGMNTWGSFLNVIRSQLTLYAEELHGMPSGVSWVGIQSIELTYVPQDNLAAFQPHLQALGGGAKMKHELPQIRSVY